MDKAPLNQSEDRARPSRKPPVTRKDAAAPEPVYVALSTPPLVYKEPIREWVTLPGPFKVRIPHPSETGYTIQPSVVEQIKQIDNEWSNFQYPGSSNAPQERCEETYLDPVTVQTLSQFGHDLQRRKEEMADAHNLPLHQQVPLADELPKDMSHEQYLALLQSVIQRTRLDEQIYRTMEGLSTLSPSEDLHLQPSEEQQAQLLTEGAQLLIEGLVYPPTNSSFMQQNLKSEQFSTALNPPLQTLQISAAQPPPKTTQTITSNWLQTGESFNQQHSDPTTSTMSQQMINIGMARHDHPAFESGVTSPQQTARLSSSTARVPGPIIPGRMLLEHDLMRQKEGVQQARQIASEIIKIILREQPSLEWVRYYLHVKKMSILVVRVIWNDPELIQWREQKTKEHRAEVERNAWLFWTQDLSYSAALTLCEQDSKTPVWLDEVAKCAIVLGWKYDQKREEMLREIQSLAQKMVSKDVGYNDVVLFTTRKKVPQIYIKRLFEEMVRRGWNIQRKQAEYQQQQQETRQNPALPTQNQTPIPFQQQQTIHPAQQPSNTAMRAMTSPMQIANPFPNMQGGGSIASPKMSARKDTTSPTRFNADGNDNRHPEAPDPWENQSEIFPFPESSSWDLSTGGLTPVKPDTVRHQPRLTTEQTAHSVQGTSDEQVQTKTAAPTARMLGERPAEDQAEPETTRIKRRGFREWKTG